MTYITCNSELFQTIMNLDYLLTHLEEIAEYFKRTIDLNDGIIDGQVVFNDYTPDLVSYFVSWTNLFPNIFYDFEATVSYPELKVQSYQRLFYSPKQVACYETSLLILKTVFAWTGFQALDQRAMLKNGKCSFKYLLWDNFTFNLHFLNEQERVILYFRNGLTFWHLNLIAGLSRVAGRSNPKLTEKSSLNDLIVGAVKHLSLFAKSVINVGCGDALLKLIDSIQNCFQVDSDVDLIRKSMNEMAKSFLETEWRAVDGNVEKGAKFNGNIESILNIYLSTNDRLLEALAGTFPVKKLTCFTFFCVLRSQMSRLILDKNKLRPLNNLAFLVFLCRRDKTSLLRKLTSIFNNSPYIECILFSLSPTGSSLFVS